jgi:hypothetical protein
MEVGPMDLLFKLMVVAAPRKPFGLDRVAVEDISLVMEEPPKEIATIARAWTDLFTAVVAV